MKIHYYLFVIVLSGLLITSCKKEQMVSDPYQVFKQPYTTGVISFQYPIQLVFTDSKRIVDTAVSFTSVGDNPSEWDFYGYSKPSTPWVLLQRLNPDDFQNRVIIFFPGTNLNALTLPHTFLPDESLTRDAQINYVIGIRPFVDTSGHVVYGTNTYAASTADKNFTLTILSRENNRLQGIFDGELKNQDGQVITCKNGLFDIQIVEK